MTDTTPSIASTEISAAAESSKLRRLWLKLPVWVRAISMGYLVMSVGGLVSFPLVMANLRVLPSVPWSLPVVALTLWVYWQYLAGKGWPQSTAESRRHSLRARPMSAAFWGRALVAGGLGSVSVIALRFLLPRLFRMTPPSLGVDLTDTPLLTVWGIIVTVALVAGITEEAGFRGYMQRPLEERYGLAAAIVITGFVFWFAHLSHGWLGLSHLPFHLAVSLVFGVLVARCGSIWPAIALHTAADLLLIPIYLFEKPDFLYRSLIVGPVWETGVDASFIAFLLATVVFGLASVVAFRRLRLS